MLNKPRESSALLLILGIVFLLPPIALIFVKPIAILGIPLPAFYLFCVWVLLIIGANLISRKLNIKSD